MESSPLSSFCILFDEARLRNIRKCTVVETLCISDKINWDVTLDELDKFVGLISDYCERDFRQGCGSGSGSWKRKRWKRSFSVEAEAEAEARKIPPLPLPHRGKNGKRKEIGSAILRRRTNRGA